MSDHETQPTSSDDVARTSGAGEDAPANSAEAAATSTENGSSVEGAPSTEDAKDDAKTEGTGEAAKAAEADATKGDAKDDAPPTLTRGNPLRWKRGGITALLGSIFAFLFMAHNGQLRFGVPLGGLGVLVAAFGLMDFVGTFDDPEERVEGRTTLGHLAWPLAHVVSGAILFGLALMGGQSGWGPQWLWGILVTATFLALVVAVFEFGVKLGPWAHDELGMARSITKRHGFWVVFSGALLYLPCLGSYSLWDPWETHYGEVAREILARDDWISLWWAQDGWFFSKPILNFWIQSLSMATLGTHYQPDQMLMGMHGATAHPEWVVRAPNFLMTVVAMYLLYKGVAKVFGRRAGLLGGIVLATMPDWFFLAHQTMTDMPFVSSMTGAMGLLLLGLHTDETREASLYEVAVGKAKLRFSGWHLVFGSILVCALPQVLYLLSRNFELVLHGSGAHGIRNHWDEFKSGSGMGNCGLPGNEACTPQVPASVPRGAGMNPEGAGQILLRLFGGFEPSIQALLWAVLLGVLLYINWGERRVRRLYYLAAWFLAAISTMAKGPAGFALPMICAFAYVCTKKRFAELLRLEMLSGLLIILAVALPWYVAMYVRHGSPFTDRLIFHDMFNRAFSHVHDTNEGDDTSFRFYIWQLGYAVFPWTGLAPLGLLYWLRRSDAADRGRGDASIFLLMWFLFAFALFSFMGTKFHHYIFPAVPPIAMLIGVVLDDMLGKRYFPSPDPVLEPHTMGADAAPVAAAIADTREETPDEDGEAPHREAAKAPVPADTAEREREREKRSLHESLMFGGAAVAGALALGLVARDLAGKPENSDQPGAIRLLQLFTYNYRRPWPDTLDFSTTLTVFGIAAVVLLLLFAVRAIRHHAVAAFTGFAVVFALWGIDDYMVKTAPHWGQHEVIEAYYANRAGADEPLIAYQMNWKGENFYTGNHVPAYVSSGSTFTTWVKQQKEHGTKVMYFVTEHSRVGGLKSETGARSYREVTDKALCNKFVLVRAEL